MESVWTFSLGLNFKNTKQSNLRLALSHHLKMALIQKIAPTMRFMKMLADCRIFCGQQHVEKGARLCS